LFQFRNGVQGLLITHAELAWPFGTRLIGSEGTIEAGPGGEAPLRLWGKGQSEWHEVELPNREHSDLDDLVPLGVLDLIDALKSGREPELSARRALQATELIFATYESSRRRGRVDLPLDIDDSPLLAMLQ
jgi:predicted dehydrogenase